MKFIADHQANPDIWTATAIAKEYSINQDKLGIMSILYICLCIYNLILNVANSLGQRLQMHGKLKSSNSVAAWIFIVIIQAEIIL